MNAIWTFEGGWLVARNDAGTLLRALLVGHHGSGPSCNPPTWLGAP